MGGSTNCMSNAVDISKWMLFHLNKGRNQAGQQIMTEDDIATLQKRRNTISAPTIEKYFSRPQVPVPSLEENYALGWKNGVYRGKLSILLQEQKRCPHKKRCSVRLYLQLFVGGLMSYLRYLCFFAYGNVQHILCCVFVLLFFVLCDLCCQFLWIVHFFIAPFSWSVYSS